MSKGFGAALTAHVLWLCRKAVTGGGRRAGEGGRTAGDSRGRAGDSEKRAGGSEERAGGSEERARGGEKPIMPCQGMPWMPGRHGRSSPDTSTSSGVLVPSALSPGLSAALSLDRRPPAPSRPPAQCPPLTEGGRQRALLTMSAQRLVMFVSQKTVAIGGGTRALQRGGRGQRRGRAQR